MKAQGYKAKLIWEKPLESGWVRVAAPVIRESSLNIAANNPAMKKALDRLSGMLASPYRPVSMFFRLFFAFRTHEWTLLKPLGVEE